MANEFQVPLRGENLYRSFGEGDAKVVALDHVSLDIRAGKVTLLMGPSGSGKTTLLAVLSGLLRPESGRVICLGEDLWELDDKARERFRLRHCGYIFQGYNLFNALTARQQLEIVLRWGEGLSASDARRRADEVLDLLDLSHRANARPAELSGGEKQRVAIGRALVKNPELLFADEPTSALDWAQGEQVVALLQYAARKRGATVLIVAHEERIKKFADEVHHLQDGKLLEEPDYPAIVGHIHANSSSTKLVTP
jgi:putative ABC transport system ATP-binding protein